MSRIGFENQEGGLPPYLGEGGLVIQGQEHRIGKPCRKSTKKSYKPTLSKRRAKPSLVKKSSNLKDGTFNGTESECSQAKSSVNEPFCKVAVTCDREEKTPRENCETSDSCLTDHNSEGESLFENDILINEILADASRAGNHTEPLEIKRIEFILDSNPLYREHLARFTNLTELILIQQNIQATDGEEIWNLGGICPFLRIVNLSENCLTSLRCISGCEGIETLNVSGNKISCLEDALSYLEKLKKVDLSDNCLTSLAGIECLLIKSKNTSFVHDQVSSASGPSSSRIDRNVASSKIEPSLPNPLPILPVTGMNGAHSSLGPSPSERENEPALQSLDVAGNRIHRLAHYLRDFSNLRRLNLSDNLFCDLGVLTHDLSQTALVTQSANQNSSLQRTGLTNTAEKRGIPCSLSSCRIGPLDLNKEELSGISCSEGGSGEKSPTKQTHNSMMYPRLQHISLGDLDHGSNPICHHNGYVNGICASLPNLKSIDDRLFSSAAISEIRLENERLWDLLRLKKNFWRHQCLSSVCKAKHLLQQRARLLKETISAWENAQFAEHTISGETVRQKKAQRTGKKSGQICLRYPLNSFQEQIELTNTLWKSFLKCSLAALSKLHCVAQTELNYFSSISLQPCLVPAADSPSIQRVAETFESFFALSEFQRSFGLTGVRVTKICRIVNEPQRMRLRNLCTTLGVSLETQSQLLVSFPREGDLFANVYAQIEEAGRVYSQEPRELEAPIWVTDSLFCAEARRVSKLFEKRCIAQGRGKKFFLRKDNTDLSIHGQLILCRTLLPQNRVVREKGKDRNFAKGEQMFENSDVTTDMCLGEEMVPMNVDDVIQMKIAAYPPGTDPRRIFGSPPQNEDEPVVDKPRPMKQNVLHPIAFSREAGPNALLYGVIEADAVLPEWLVQFDYLTDPAVGPQEPETSKIQAKKQKKTDLETARKYSFDSATALREKRRRNSTLGDEAISLASQREAAKEPPLDPHYFYSLNLFEKHNRDLEFVCSGRVHRRMGGTKARKGTATLSYESLLSLLASSIYRRKRLRVGKLVSSFPNNSREVSFQSHPLTVAERRTIASSGKKRRKPRTQLRAGKFSVNHNFPSMSLSHTSIAFQYLNSLTLRGIGLKSFSPNLILRLNACKKLKCLDLSYNLIEDISEIFWVRDSEIAIFTHLKFLRVSYNLIESFTAPLYSVLPELRCLDLQHNKIAHLDDVEISGKLQHLNLDGNPATATPELRRRATENFSKVVRCDKRSCLSINSLKTEVDVEFDERSINLAQTVEGQDPMLAINSANCALKVIPDSWNFRFTRCIDLSCNQIRSIKGLEKCGLLEELYLEHNEVTDLDPVMGLSRLVTLNASYNKLDAVDLGWDPASLQELNLTANSLTTLAPFPNLPSLVALFLSENCIASARDMRALADLQLLTSVFLDNNPCTEDPAFRSYTVFHLKKLKFLNGVPVTGAERSACSEVHSGRLSPEILEHRLKSSPPYDLEEVDLSGMRIRNIGTELTPQLFPSIRHLTLARNAITCINSIGRLDELESLNLNRNRIDVERGISVLFHESPLGHPFLQLEVLDLSSNKLLEHNHLDQLNLPSLIKLNLAENEFIRIGALPKMANLLELDLSGNKIRGFDSLSLTGPRQLKTLNLERNKIKSLAGFPSLSALKTLSLAANRICDVVEFENLAACKSVLSISVHSTPFARKHYFKTGLLRRFPELQFINGTEVTWEERECSNNQSSFSMEPGSTSHLSFSGESMRARESEYYEERQACTPNAASSKSGRVPVKLTSFLVDILLPHTGGSR